MPARPSEREWFQWIAIDIPSQTGRIWYIERLEIIRCVSSEVLAGGFHAVGQG